ncbi:MAG: nuclear transport factor 2 family protein, partial [Bacteroidota bacterium]
MNRGFVLVFFLLFSFILKAQSGDQRAIEATLNNYIDGFYKGDANKLKAALKPRLYKFGYLRNKKTGKYEYYQHMNFQQAIAFVEKMKAEGRSRDEKEIRKAEVLDIGNHIASAKITAVWGIDYVLLSKDNGKWMIEQVIWEGPYAKDTRNNS